MIRRILSIALLPLGFASAYEPTLESLSKVNPAPEWFRDAKVGIYFHWGVYSVPAFAGEWYPRHMHEEGHRAHTHHLETWGDPAEFGYHDFVPLFRAEHFDAEEWAELFERAGARFAGPVAEHHDGFAMWASKVTPWNAKDRGPKRDLTGELAKALRARGMKFVATFHHARNNLWEKDGRWTGHYAYNTLDQNVIIGPHHEVGNFVFMNGFSGHGMQQSPAVGRGVSELITYGEFRSLDLSPFGYERVVAHEPVVETAVI